MAIDGDKLYEEKRDKFNAQSIETRFLRDYIVSVNYAIDEIVAQLDVPTAPAYIDSQSDDIDLPANRRTAISMWVDYYLVDLGHRSGDLNLNTAFARAERATRRAIQLQTQADIATAQTTAEADDTTQNFIASLEDN